LKDDESGKPFHVRQAEQVALYRQARKDAGHAREPRVSVSRSIFALTDERDWQYFGRDRYSSDQVGNIDAKTRAVFGKSYAGEPDELAKKLAEDEAIAAADTLLLTVPNQLGVDYNAHVIESVLK
ncbi:monooxygenase, partial [Escherichia coli]|nr:monooxygenase [Escherichia coli]